ncbi:MAG: translation initiation factor IF-6 [Thermoplasmata archaeon]
MLRKVDFSGNPYVGVFCNANDSILVASPHVPLEALKRAGTALEVLVVQTTLGGSTIIGSLIAMNSHAALVTNFAEMEEVAKLGGIDVYRLDHKLNAVGNNILVNDRGAICHPGYGRQAIQEMEDVFGVEVEPSTIGGMRTVGSAAVANNKGALCHPHSSEEELKIVKEVLRVKPVIATANYGTPQLGACVVGNDRGAVMGTPTTPIELGRIEEGLQLF